MAIFQFFRKCFNPKGLKKYDIETKVLFNGRPHFIKHTIEAETRSQAQHKAMNMTREKVKIYIHSTVRCHIPQK